LNHCCPVKILDKWKRSIKIEIKKGKYLFRHEINVKKEAKEIFFRPALKNGSKAEKAP
jgi:hypothetical protein